VNTVASQVYGPQQSASFDLTTYLNAFMRRSRWFFAVLLVLLAVTISVTTFLPSRYSSSATILIEQQEIPPDLVRTTISTYADQRLEMIQQRVMTRDTLLGIIKKYDLYPRERDRMPIEELLDEIRGNINIDVVSGQFIDPRRGVPTKATIAFELGFEDKSPEKAFKVANELYTLYYEENLRNRTETARETSTFLEMEAEKLNGQALELEKQLATFKEEHVDELPELLSVNWQMYDRTEEELRELARSRRTLQDQLLMLETDLVSLNPYQGTFSETGARILSPSDRLATLRSELAQIEARYKEDHPDVQRIRMDIASLEQAVDSRQRNRSLAAEIESARAELARIRERYSENHPDVILLSSQIGALAKQLDGKLDETSGDVDASNPAYLQLETRVKTTRLELEALDAREREVRRKRAELAERIARTPKVEQEFREMAREYTNAATKFQEVKAKQLEAELAESLEAERKGEKFTLIEPPQVPETPVSPNRPLIFAIGFVLSLGFAASAVILLELSDSRIYGASAIEAVLGVSPTASIPVIASSSDARRSRRLVVAVLVAAAGLIALALAAVHFLIVPLDAAVAIVLNRYGPK